MGKRHVPFRARVGTGDRRRLRPSLAAILVVAAVGATTVGSAAADPKPRTATVAAGPRYRAGALHRVVFGTRYRDQWAAPLDVEVLDLATYSGGLVPIKGGGGKETKSLHFRGADGREWKFRSIDKDPSAVLAPELRDTFVDAIAQDQISAAHPLGPLVVDALSEAAGILHVPHRLVLLPDDPGLGAFRAEFAGVLGFLEERVSLRQPVTPGFSEFTKLLDTVELWQRLDANPGESVDARAFLRARLFDVFINDFDRHKDQWRWVRRQGDTSWEPIPEDRDQAFVRFDGLILSAVRPSQPRLVDFHAEYPNIAGLTWQGRFVDRRHLASLDRDAWRSVVDDLQGRLTDAAIDAAVSRLPAEYLRLDAGRLAGALKVRRRDLPKAAAAFYALLAADVEVHASDASERVDLNRAGQHDIDVRVTAPGGAITFARRIDDRETRSLRLYLAGGNDEVVRGPGVDGVTIRVVGGSGDDVLDDSRSGHTLFYDESGENVVKRGPGTLVDTRPYVQPLDKGSDPARDWGHVHLFRPWLSAGADQGVVVGQFVDFTRFGFRRHPYAQRHTLGLAYATGPGAFHATYASEFIATDSAAALRLAVDASQADLIHFYGFGNDAPKLGRSTAYRLEERRIAFTPSYRFNVRAIDLSAGAVAQYTDTPGPREDLLGARGAYGLGRFGQAGIRAALLLDRRNHVGAATRGGMLRLGGTAYPALWDVEHAFGEVHGDAAAYLGAHGLPTLALRAGGRRVFGQRPFGESAFLGGPDSVRGLETQRYAGQGVAFGNAELRLHLFQARLLLPSEIGVFGFADAGRVFEQHEASDRWHTGWGGGLSVGVLKPENTITVALARSEGATKLYLQGGFAF